MAQLVETLRTCPVCGLQAYTDADLNLFKKDKTCLYGRNNLCSNCDREYKRKHIRQRTGKFIEIFRVRSFDEVIRCYFCGDEVTKLKGQNHNSLSIHSLDGNHENWNPINKVPAHIACHTSFHNLGERSPNWKGDEASKSAKRKRVRQV